MLDAHQALCIVLPLFAFKLCKLPNVSLLYAYIILYDILIVFCSNYDCVIGEDTHPGNCGKVYCRAEGQRFHTQVEDHSVMYSF